MREPIFHFRKWRLFYYIWNLMCRPKHFLRPILNCICELPYVFSKGQRPVDWSNSLSLIWSQLDCVSNIQLQLKQSSIFSNISSAQSICRRKCRHFAWLYWPYQWGLLLWPARGPAAAAHNYFIYMGLGRARSCKNYAHLNIITCGSNSSGQNTRAWALCLHDCQTLLGVGV